jgi:hypothetical protein
VSVVCKKGKGFSERGKGGKGERGKGGKGERGKGGKGERGKGDGHLGIWGGKGEIYINSYSIYVF